MSRVDTKTKTFEEEISFIIKELSKKLRNSGSVVSAAQEEQLKTVLTSLCRGRNDATNSIWLATVLNPNNSKAKDSFYLTLTKAVNGGSPETIDTFKRLLSCQLRMMVEESSVAQPELANGEEREFYANVNHNVVSYIRESGVARIPKNYWLTDVDALKCLGKLVTKGQKIEGSDKSVLVINAAGNYLLSPESFSDERYEVEGVVYVSDPAGAVSGSLSRLYAAIVEAGINDKLTVQFPVCGGNNHWMMVQITIENQTINDAVIFNSTFGYGATKRILADAIKRSAFDQRIDVSMKHTGLQKNGWSCMDFTLQTAFKHMGVENAVTRAGSNTTELRKAVIGEIINQTDEFSGRRRELSAELDKCYPAPKPVQSYSTKPAAAAAVSHAAVAEGNLSTEGVKNIDIDRLRDELASVSANVKNYKQIKMDSMMAKELQMIYDKLPAKATFRNESRLVDLALKRAARRYTLEQSSNAKTTLFSHSNSRVEQTAVKQSIAKQTVASSSVRQRGQTCRSEVLQDFASDSLAGPGTLVS